MSHFRRVNTLHLPVKREYFDAIKNGTKCVEYRLFSDYWEKRIRNTIFKTVEITLGYPKRDDKSRRLTFKWDGYTIGNIQHQEFGKRTVRVFEISLEGKRL